ncbi:MAG: hypothetical protein BMS9Abin37_1974 [Acidobacteriota bacterium]|nr:MAG: hypothetical protein BMS9Abin37_1974 [Acidobacteriota bacterium]
MTARNYQVKELTRVSGVTVRTLHYYDSLGLLTPSARSDAGYRLYSEDDLYRLQQILLWRERGFALEQIRKIIDDPEGGGILDSLAEKMRQGLTAGHDDAVELAERHRLHIDRWFYPCSREMHEGLAEMYLTDQRFASKIDGHGEGLTNFLVDAIRANAGRD